MDDKELPGGAALLILILLIALIVTCTLYGEKLTEDCLRENRSTPEVCYGEPGDDRPY